MAGHYHLNLHFNYKINLVSHVYCLVAELFLFCLLVCLFFYKSNYALVHFWLFTYLKLVIKTDLLPDFIS